MNVSIGERVQIGPEQGSVTETDALNARVKLDSGRVLKIDRRLLKPVPAEPESRGEEVTPAAPVPAPKATPKRGRRQRGE